MRDCIRKGRFPSRSGERNAASKFTVEDVRSIRTMLNVGLGCAEIARYFGVTKKSEWGIKAGRTG